MVPDLSIVGQHDKRLNRPSLAAEEIDSPRHHPLRTPLGALDDAFGRDGLSYTFFCSTSGKSHEHASYTDIDSGALDDEVSKKLTNLEERSSEIARFSETLSLDGHENKYAQKHHDDEDVIGSKALPTLTDMFGEMNASSDTNSTFVPESILVHSTPVAENDEVRPHLVHKSDSTEIYRIKDIGIKVLVGEISLEEQKKRLGHEHNITNFLSSSSRQRKVIEKKDYDGRPALWFKWEEGVTLRSWLQKPGVDLTSRVRAAIAIAKNLSEFHDGGVFYNNLSIDDIVLNTVEGVDIATFVDLSKSGFIDMRPKADKEYTDMLRRTDLKMMGHVFRAIFHGHDPSFQDYDDKEIVLKDILHENDTRDHHHKKRGKPSSPGDFLPNSQSCLPIYIHSLVSLLISPGSKSCIGYSNAKDVWLDLTSFSEKPNRNIKWVETEQSIGDGKLKLGGDMMFYGRQVQLSMIHHFFESVIRNDACPLMSVISGCPGAGKSTSVNQIKNQFRDKNLLLIEGKFNKFSRPDSVLTSALDVLFANMIAETNTSDTSKSMRKRLRDAFGYENGLYEAIPHLLVFLQGDTSIAHLSPTMGCKKQNQIEFMLCRLIGAIASDEIPLIIYLDDLQWADQATLDLIGMLMLDPSIKYFGILGCYRDNEVDKQHPLSGLLEAIRLNGAPLRSIHVGPIERECVNSILSDVLCFPPSLCLPLSTVVHRMTGGVILFVIRFLKTLNKEGSLVYSMTSRRWTWDLEKIKSKRVSKDVVIHTALQMNSLPKLVQIGFMSAACLGSNFNASILGKTIEDEEFDVGSFLEISKDGGYIEESGLGSFSGTHDQIQQAAYDLIPPTQRESFHYQLGQRLLENSTKSEMKRDTFFYIVDNMNKGVGLKLDRNQKTQLASLNLQASNIAISTTRFLAAAEYLQTGISLLSKDSWTQQYDLTIQLYDAALEAYYTAGQFSKFDAAVKQPLTHARCFEDKLNSYHNLVRYLTASGKSEEALETCLSVLKTLGVEISPNANSESMLAEAISVKEIIRKSHIHNLLDLPRMKDLDKMAAMTFLNTAVLCSYETNEFTFFFVICQMVKISIQHGLCSISAVAFSLYGALLTCPIISDFDESYEMGRLALRAIDKLDAFMMKQQVFLFFMAPLLIARILYKASDLNNTAQMTIGTNVLTSLSPNLSLKIASAPKLLEGYEAAFALGDMESVTAHLQLYAGVAVWGCGEKLTKAEEIIRIHAKRMLQHKQVVSCKNILIHLQQATELIGLNEDVYSTFFNSSEEAFFRQEMNCRGAHTRKLLLHTCRMYLAVMRGNMELAALEYESNGAEYQGGIRFIGTITRVFLAGLVGFYIARKQRSDLEKWIQIGVRSMDTMKSWTKDSSWNYEHKLFLLEAEYYFLKGDKHEHLASAKYKQSIAAAKKHKFKNDEGLSAQKAAVFHLHYNRKKEALAYFQHAKACYESWGAAGLVKEIEITISSLSQ